MRHAHRAHQSNRAGLGNEKRELSRYPQGMERLLDRRRDSVAPLPRSRAPRRRRTHRGLSTMRLRGTAGTASMEILNDVLRCDTEIGETAEERRIVGAARNV